jgi:hypothetical protein
MFSTPRRCFIYLVFCITVDRPALALPDQKAPTSLKPLVLVGGVHRYRAHHRPLGAAIEIGESILNVECTKFVKNANVGVIYG